MANKEFQVRHGLVVNGSINVTNQVNIAGVSVTEQFQTINTYMTSAAAAGNSYAENVGVSANSYASEIVSNTSFVLSTNMANNALAANNYAGAMANSANVFTSSVYDVTNVAFGHSNVTYAAVNSAFAVINAGYTTANSSYSHSNDTYAAVNSAFAVINAAFASANNVAPQVKPAFDTANAGYNQANAATGIANYGAELANANYTRLSAAYDVTNSAYTLANADSVRLSAGYTVANAAFDLANTKFSSSGGTVSGSVSIVGDLIISGNTIQVGADTLRVSDPLIYLAGNNYTSDIIDIGFIANYVNTGGANVHTGLYREHENKEYYLFQGYAAEPINNHIGAMSNNMTLSVLNADIRTSNLNLGGANAITWISSGYGVANAAFGAANGKVATVSGTSGRITSSGTTGITLDLATAGAGAATYSSGVSSITVDAYGRVTSVTGSAGYPTATGSGASGTWPINISGAANSVISNDSTGRDASTVTPSSISRLVRYDFVGAGTAGTGGNYAGVMTYAPWTGTTASTGDASYQLAFGSTATNSSGNPALNIRKGIDTTWNSWFSIPLYGSNYNTGALYSTIVYDSNNTAYYVDPASTSVLSGLSVSSTISGSINGSAVSSTTAAKSSADTSIATTAFAKSLFYTASTSGTTDWNHASNLNPGVGTTLLLGTATNGPGGGNYYHPLNISYSDLGTGGEITQLAICYATPGNELYMRGRYSNSWSSWVRFLNTSNYSTYAMPRDGMPDNADNYVNFRVMRNNNSASVRDGMYIGYGNSNSGVTRIYGGGATSGEMTKYSTYTTEPGSFRSPLFYDSNDTTYYIDGAGTSILTRLKLATVGTSWIGGFRGDAGITSSTVGTVSSFHSWYTARTPSGGFAFGTLNNDFYFKWATNANIDAGTNNTDNLFLIGSGGTCIAYGDSRAPVFYDLDNTGYYANPNGTSNFNGASFASQVNISTGTSQPLVLTTSSSGPWALSLTRSDVPSTISVFNNNAHWYFSHYCYAPSFRAPIFYDNDNTAYYVDPTGGSNLSGIIYHVGSSIIIGQYSGATRGYLYNDTGGFGLLSNAGNWALRVDYGSQNVWFPTYAYASGSFRTPIFYDSDNTNYYWQPDFSSAHRFQTPSGYVTIGPQNTSWCHFGTDRSQFYFGSQIAVDGNIFSYGSNTWARFTLYYDAQDTGYYVDPNATSSLNSVNYYNLYYQGNTEYGFKGTNVYADTINSGAVGDPLELCYHRGAYTTTSGSMRAPLFYDRDDTGCYVDPNSGTSASFDGNVVFRNKRKGLIGVYDPANTQAIWSMGAAYVLTDGGTSTQYGSLYGLAWSYNPDYSAAGNNPQSKSGLGHQMLLMFNGITKTSIGDGIWTNGAIYAAGNITAYSDRTLKTNVKTIENASDMIKKMRGVYFDWIKSGEHSIGMIAQEVEEVVPELISETDQCDEEDNGKIRKIKTLDYSKLVAVLIEGFKEQQEKIDKLESLVQQLLNK